jgi:sugar lactone lactonase YvrE
MVRLVADVDAVLKPSAGLAEAPVWDWTRQMLLWVDIDRMEVNLSDVSKGRTTTHRARTRIGSVFLGEGSDLLLAASDGLYSLDLCSGRSVRAVSLPRDAEPANMNDGEVDPAGRVWAGTMSLDRRRAAGALYRFDIEGAVVALPSVTLSNGLSWSPDYLLMYYIDSATQRVDVFDYDVSDSSIHNRRPFVAIPSQVGMPDGLAVDSEGCVWVAIWGSGSVQRYSPKGRLDAVVKLPTPNVSSCCFGGRVFDTLYVTTATRGLSVADPDVDGAIYACDPKAVGIPTRRAHVSEPLGQEDI